MTNYDPCLQMRISPGLCWIFQSSWVQMKEQTEYLYANYGFILFPVGLGGFQGGYEAPKPPNLGVRRHEAPKPPKRWWMVVGDQVRVHHFTFGMLLGTFQGTINKEKLLFPINVLIFLCWVNHFYFFPPAITTKKTWFCVFFSNMQTTYKYKFYAFATSKNM